MINNILNVRLILTSLIPLLIVGCSDDKSDLYRYIKEVKSKTSHAIEPIPQFQPLPKFKFPEGGDRRNPFKAVDLKKRNEALAPDSNRKKQPLEAYPLDALKFVGTLKEANEVWGLIKEPDGQIVRVKISDYMGQNYGKIIMIKNDFLKLEETIKISGAWEKQITTINLYTGK